MISASILCLAGAPAEAHHHARHTAHATHVAHAPRHARAAHRSHRAAHRAHSRRTAHRARHLVRKTVGEVPAFSALVIDVNTGKTLYSVSEDGLRHPASITKVMTLYLLFEELDRGAMTMQTRIPISKHAAAQEPSKLGLAPGNTISVGDAIKAVVTRSANDIAVAIAEAIGGTESNFSDMMTRQARALGMTNTVYVNASGLPDDQQVTTARDLTILGRAMEERFPRYFHYFSLAKFEFDGKIIGNHDHLLGRVDGVDGIKTGYTRGSGFNLLTSVHLGGRSLIAVVMGGHTAAGRDRIMENLIADHIAEASPSRTAPAIAEASPAEPAVMPPVRPRPVLAAEPAVVRVAATTGAQSEITEGDNSAGDDEGPAPQPTAADLGWDKGPDGVKESAEIQARLAAASALVMPLLPPERPESADEESDGSARGWMIQIGAADDLAKAKALLIRARERNPSILASAKPFTEKVRKGDATLYRARFAGLDSDSAQAACRSLKRTGFACFTAHDD